VSFIVGLILDKFAWHLPLYRQHQRLAAAGITVSRGWLTQLVQDAARLLGKRLGNTPRHFGGSVHATGFGGLPDVR
jgi:transposase